jgi:hypothetical protein
MPICLRYSWLPTEASLFPLVRTSGADLPPSNVTS